ncbi:ferrochelatase [Neisseriaceae bacterium CLB008]
MTFLAEPNHNHAQFQPKVGVLLLNLGTPDAPETKPLRRYLNQFLSDKRVVELPSWLWQPILKGIILTFRPKQSAQKYRRIWFEAGSPLAYYTQQQAALLGQALQAKSDLIVVDYAMRYGNPSVQSVLTKMKQQGVTRLFVLPLYPQYAGSSSATALDEVFRTLMQQRNMMDVRTVSRFHDHPAYINSLANHIRRHWQQHGRGDKLLMSFHGVPEKTLHQGDPYFCECHKTARLLAQALELKETDYVVCFQSRFGKAKWVGPSTQDLFSSLPKKQGVKNIDVVCPGFVSDCLETLEEINDEGRELFIDAGGKGFQYIPCLNTEPEWLDALASIVQEHTEGWIPAQETGDKQDERLMRVQAVKKQLG